MSSLKEEYNKFIQDIEQNISNKEDLEYVRNRFEMFMNSSVNRMEEIVSVNEVKIQSLEQTQNILDDKIEKIQEVIGNIERDIYSEEGFDFEIVCPYCNYEFVIDIDENRTEVECPECNNIIELDWSGHVDDDNNEEQGCNGGCHGCNGCEEDHKTEDDDM